jgi:hypothetical protein
LEHKHGYKALKQKGKAYGPLTSWMQRDWALQSVYGQDSLKDEINLNGTLLDKCKIKYGMFQRVLVGAL